MGHFHYPVARGSDSVRFLEGLFDAVVEIRHHDGTLQQRWEFPDKDVQSTWLQL